MAENTVRSTSRGGRFVSSLPMGRSSSEGSDNKSYKGPFSGQETETDEVKPPPGLGTGVTVFRQQEIA